MHCSHIPEYTQQQQHRHLQQHQLKELHNLHQTWPLKSPLSLWTRRQAQRQPHQHPPVIPTASSVITGTVSHPVGSVITMMIVVITVMRLIVMVMK